jgi:hypothetical protein
VDSATAGLNSRKTGETLWTKVPRDESDRSP